MSDVRTESATVAAMARHWPMVRALMGGTSAMRAAGKTYLPAWPNEGAESYDARLATATLYPAYGRTIEVLAGKPFSKALTLGDDVPVRIAEWMEDCDLQGNNLHSFASELMGEVIGYGLSGVLVDYPRSDGVRTLADERAVGARPYFTRYGPGTILGWRSGRVQGVMSLLQLRLLETYEEEDGEFGTKEAEQVRVLIPGAWQVYRKVESSTHKSEWLIHDEGTTTLDAIPFVFFYGKRTAFGTSAVPLLDLAYQNVEHWQSASDQQTILHVARVPILATIGADMDGEITVGAQSAVKLPHGADMKFIEHTGSSIGAGKESIESLEDRMRQTGAELLVMKPGKITATQSVNDADANKSALQRIVEGVEDGLDQCLIFVAQWVGEQAAGTVSLYKDFGAQNLTEATGELLLKLQMGGLISRHTTIKEYQRRGTLSPDIDPDDEAELVGADGGVMPDLDAA